MIISRINGGLGNQLFQYAIGRKLSIKFNTKLLLDNSLYRWSIKRKYLLSQFNIVGSTAKRSEIAKFRNVPNIVEELLSIYVYRRDTFNFTDKVFAENKFFRFDRNVHNCSANCYLSGFWQNEGYFKSIRETLLNELTLVREDSLWESNIAKRILSSNSVSIHIRRGDYLRNNKYYGTLDDNYYINAARFFNNKYQNISYFIFTDDIHWAKNNLSLGNNVTFVSTFKLKDEEELILMSWCKHNIIANSSFSWWGAWLNSNIDKIVVSPKNWFADNGMSNNILPKEWVKM